MKTITRPVNPFRENFTDEGLAWEKGAEAMENYYQEALQPPLDLLMSAGVEVEKHLGGAFGNLLQVLTLIGIDEETEKERQAANKQEMSK